MEQRVGTAARLPGRERKKLAIHALVGTETVTNLAVRHGVSRKFVYQQTHKAREALGDAFSPAVPDGAVLFELAVTKAWLRQVIVALVLICRGSYHGVVEFVRDLHTVVPLRLALALIISLAHGSRSFLLPARAPGRSRPPTGCA